MYDAIIIVADSIHILRCIELCSETLSGEDVQLACAGRPCVASDGSLTKSKELTDRDLRNDEDREAFSFFDNTVRQMLPCDR